MRTVLNTIIILVLLGWLIGYFGYHTGGLFHLILIIAVVAIIIQLLPGNKAD